MNKSPEAILHQIARLQAELDEAQQTLHSLEPLRAQAAQLLQSRPPDPRTTEPYDAGQLEPILRRRTAALSQANRRLQLEIAEHRRLSLALRLLSDAGRVMLRSSSEHDLFAQLCRLAVESGGYQLAWVGRAESDKARTIRPVACAGCQNEYIAQLDLSWSDAPRDDHPAGQAIRAGQVIVSNGLPSRYRPTNSRAGGNPEQCAAAALPLLLEDRPWGVLCVHHVEPEGFGPREVALLRELAGNLAVGLASLEGNREHQRVVEALAASERRYRQIVETAEEGVWILDRDNRTTFANHKMAELLGCRPEELLGEPIFAFLDASARQRVREALVRRRQGRKEVYDLRLLRRDGRPLHALVCSAPILDEDNRYAGTLKMVTDITERRRLEDRVARIAQREQQRIGQELQDVVGQTLTGLAFLSKILEQKLRGRLLAEAEDAGSICELINQSMKQVQSLTKGLQTVARRPDGLRRALGEFVSDIQGLYGVTCHFRCQGDVRVADYHVATHLFHIAREAAANAVRHASPSRIAIDLAEGPGGQLVLVVANDGVGFAGVDVQTGLGLRIMDQRAVAIGAALEVRPDPVGGTIVRCVVPGTAAGAEVESIHGHTRDHQQQDQEHRIHRR